MSNQRFPQLLRIQISPIKLERVSQTPKQNTQLTSNLAVRQFYRGFHGCPDFSRRYIIKLSENKEQTWGRGDVTQQPTRSEKPPGIRCNLSDFCETCRNRPTLLKLCTQQIVGRATIHQQTKEQGIL